MNSRNDIAVFILAGGKSSRMGTDKGMLELSGKSFTQHIIDTAKTISNSIMLVANTPNYKHFGIPLINDKIKEKGPMGGIYTALSNTSHTWNLFLSCDIPLIESKVLTALIDSCNEKYDTIVIKHHNTIEPLCGLYKKSLLKFFEDKIHKDELSIVKALAELNTKYLDVSNQVDGSSNCFKNVNTSQDFNDLIKILYG